MMIDNQLLFEDGLTNYSTTRVSSNVVDLGIPAGTGQSAGGLNTDFQGGTLRDRNLGAGEDIQLFMQFAVTTATSATITGTLKGADDAGITSNVVVIEATPALTIATTAVLVNYSYIMRPNLQKIRKRFFRIDWVTGGTSITTCAIVAGFVLDTQTAQPTMQMFP
jgi:hypothetical protein